MIFKKKNNADLTDEVLVRKITTTKNSDLFGIIYDRYSDKIYRKCISLVGDKDQAQDLTHDIFLKLFVSLSKFHEKSSFSTWVYRISHNFCIDYLRKENKNRFYNIDEVLTIPEDEDEKNEQLLLAIKAEQLKKVLELLKIDDKSVLLMKYQDSLSIKEISEIVDASESAVKMKIKRARAKAVETFNEKYG